MAGFSISRKELYEEIWTLSATKVAEKYDLSYTRLLKACRDNDIPIPPSGYFTKLSFGKTMERKPLSGSEDTVVVIEAPMQRRVRNSENGEAPKTHEVPSPNCEEPAGQVPDDSEPDEGKIVLVHHGDRQREQREELYQKVWEKPVSEVAKEYGISDNALRKRCINLHVPLPERGYWARLRAGKPVKQSPLPALEIPQPDKPKTGDERKLHFKEAALPLMQREDREELLSLASVLRVGNPSSKLLDPVQQQLTKCREWSNPKPQYTAGGYYIPRRVSQEPPMPLATSVSPKSYSRVFHIIDTILRALQRYEGSWSHYDQKFRVNGEWISFEITEEKDKIPHEITQSERIKMLEYEQAKLRGSYASNPQIPKYDHPWNGKLKMVIQGRYSFSDCKAYLLEDRIGEILIAFFEASTAAHAQYLKELEEHRRQMEEREKKEQEKKRYNEEIARTKALVNEAKDYATARMIREYVEAIRANPGNDGADPEWLNWASKKADWFDPTVAREDELLGKRHHADDPDQKKLERRW